MTGPNPLRRVTPDAQLITHLVTLQGIMVYILDTPP
jgi:hypothetical protein